MSVHLWIKWLWTQIQLQLPSSKRSIKFTKKKTEKKWIWWKKYQNMGKNFAFYIFLTRSRSNSLQHCYGWCSSQRCFPVNFKKFWTTSYLPSISGILVLKRCNFCSLLVYTYSIQKFLAPRNIVGKTWEDAYKVSLADFCSSVNLKNL